MQTEQELIRFINNVDVCRVITIDPADSALMVAIKRLVIRAKAQGKQQGFNLAHDITKG